MTLIVPSTDRAALLKGTSERRGISEFELRDAGDGVRTFTGYAAVWDQPYTVTDRYGEFTEIVERSAVQRTLSRNPNVVLNLDHSGLPLARTSAGTLRIGTDSHGYTVEADLEPRDPDVQRILYKLERGDVTDMSWAFRVTVDEWSATDDGAETRVIKEVNVDGGDVSIVGNGANPGTEAHPLRSALVALADPDIDLEILAECRAEGFDFDVIRKNLDSLTERAPARKTMSLRAALRALELD